MRHSSQLSDNLLYFSLYKLMPRYNNFMLYDNLINLFNQVMKSYNYDNYINAKTVLLLLKSAYATG